MLCRLNTPEAHERTPGEHGQTEHGDIWVNRACPVCEHVWPWFVLYQHTFECACCGYEERDV